MKKTPLFALLLSGALLLAGCGPTESGSTSSGNKETSTSETPIPTKDWSEEEKALLTRLMGEGHELPYFDFSSLGLDYQLKELSGGQGLRISAVGGTPKDLEEVTKAYTGDGYKLMNGSYVIPEGLYVYTKTFEDITVVEIQAAVVDSMGNYLTDEVASGTIDIKVFPSVSVDIFPKEAAEEALFRTLNADIDLPEPSKAASYYRLYEASDTNGNEYVMMDVKGGFTAYGQDLISVGWTEVHGVYRDGTYYIDPSDKVGVNISYDMVGGLSTLQFDRNLLVSEFPLTEAQAYIDTIAGEEATALPVPSTKAEGYQFENQGSLFGIMAYGDDLSGYPQDLMKAGFKLYGYEEGIRFYADPKLGYMVGVASGNGYGMIYIQAYSSDYQATWPTETVASYVSRLAGTKEVTAVLPAPDFDYDLVQVYATSAPYTFAIKDIANTGALNDLRASYAALLEKEGSGWSKQTDTQSGAVYYLDSATSSVRVDLSYDATIGTLVGLSANFPVTTSWDAGEMESAFDVAGLTGSLPAFEGGAYYVLEADFDHVSFTVAGPNVTEEAHTAYLNSLIAAGWGYGSNQYFGTIFWNPEKTIVLQTIYQMGEGGLGMAAFIVQDYDLWTYDQEAYNTSKLLLNLLVDPYFGFAPVLPVSEDTLWFVDTSLLEQGYAALSYYVFATGFASALAEDLMEIGWVTLDSTGTSYTYVLSLTTQGGYWNAFITEDTANNCTMIDIVMMA